MLMQQPFAPFRIHLSSDGRIFDVLHRKNGMGRSSCGRGWYFRSRWLSRPQRNDCIGPHRKPGTHPNACVGGLGIDRVDRLGNSLRLFADVELELPALLAIAAETPQFQSAYLGHFAVQMDRDHLSFLARRFERRRQGA